MAADPYDITRAGRVLAAAARMVHDQRDLIAGDPLLAELCAETGGVLDCAANPLLTNPVERAEYHMARIRVLVEQLPVLDGGAR